MEEKKNPFDRWSTKEDWKKEDTTTTSSYYSSKEYVPWWKREKKKSYTSRLGFGEKDHRSSYSYSYGRYGGYSYGGGYYSASSDSRKSFQNEKADILKVAFSNSRDLVNILEFPFRLNIYYDKNGYSRNHCFHESEKVEKNIFISSLDCLNFKTKSEITEEKRANCIQIISGNALHEAAHLKFTNLSPTENYFGVPKLNNLMSSSNLVYIPEDRAAMNKFLEKYPELEEYRTLMKSIIYSIFMFMEDERIETSLVEERNGWFNYITDYKDYVYNKIFSSLEIKPKEKEDTVDFQEFFITLLKFIRFRDKLDEKELIKYDKLLEVIEEYLNPNSTLSSCLKSFEIFSQVLVKVLRNNEKEIKDLDKALKDSMVEGKGEGEKEVNLTDDDLSILGMLLSSISSTSSCLNGADKSYETPFDVKNKMCDTDVDNHLLDIITGELEGNYEEKTYFMKPIGDLDSYNRTKEIISPYIPVMRNMVRNVNKNFEFIVHGQRTGKLDTTKLAEAYQGVPQVYIRQGITTTTGMNICVLIDESGSMSGRQEILAQQAAILLNESFGNIPGINLYIYGHSADDMVMGATELFIYREPGLNIGFPGQGLSESRARCENRDGTAIKAVANRVRNFTKQPVLMFILSDGNPSANGYRGSAAIADTAAKVKEVEAMNFYLIQVNLCSHCCDSELMFKNYVDVTKDISELPKILGVIVRDQVVKILQANTTTVTI